jgi:hypothetical protein
MTAATATPTLSERSAEQPEQVAYDARTPPTNAAVPARRQDAPSLVPFGEALQELVELEVNWDSYGALPPSRQALEHAWRMTNVLVENGVPVPQVFPTRRGGIQLEWHLPSATLEWEIDPEARSGVFIFDDHASGERIDGEMPADLDRLVQAAARIAAA